jgi:hypothetical protein
MAEEPPKVPPVDAQATSPEEPDGRSDYEFRLLEADAKARENLNREADQRYWLRWVAVTLVVLIILGMAIFLAHVAHWLPNEPNSTSVVVALHLAPIISMTTLAIALLVAAFRGFKDGDEKSSAAITSDGARVAGFIN